MGNFLLTIGIDEYKNQKNLANCVKDIRDISEILIDRYSFESPLHSELTDINATNKNIQDALIKLSETTGPRDNLVIIYSGHGHYDPSAKTGYWIPADAGVDYTTWISNDTILSHLNNVKCKHLVLIVDSCFSHSLLVTELSKSNEGYESKSSRWALVSAFDESYTYADPRLNSEFAKSVIEFLEQQEKEFRVTKLIEQVKDDFNLNELQSPQGYPLRLKGHKGGEYIFKVDENLDERDLKGYSNFQQVLKLYKRNTQFQEILKFENRSSKIGYQVYREFDPVIKKQIYYLYLYSGTTHTKTFKHISENKPEILASGNLVILTERDLSQSDPQRRLNNIQKVFRPINVFYIDSFIRDLCTPTLSAYKVDGRFLQILNFVLPSYRSFIGQTESQEVEVNRFVLNWFSKTNDPILVIKGTGGIGKTTFAQYIADKIVQKSPETIALFIDSVSIRDRLVKKFKESNRLNVYDFYEAIFSTSRGGELLSEVQFNVNLDAGNILLIIDGLDEVISKVPRFDVNSFINSIKEITGQLGEGKVLITCRSYFWNNSVDKDIFNVIELSPFDKKQAVLFFDKSLQTTRKRKRAMGLAEDFKLTESSEAYHPYVLDIIRSIIDLEQEEIDLDLNSFNSRLLNSAVKNDYIVFRVCDREVKRIGQLSVDDQINFFKYLSTNRRGSVKTRNFSRELRSGIGRHVDDVNVESFQAHPFLTKIQSNITFKYDFFSEIFKAIEVVDFFNFSESVQKIPNHFVEILSENCWFDSGLNNEVAKRVKTWDENDHLFTSNLIDEIAKSTLLNKEGRDLAIANIFNIALKINHRFGLNNIEENTILLKTLFGSGNNQIRNLRIVTLNSEKPIRFDFSKLEIVEAVFDSYTNFYQCVFDQDTKFISSSFFNIEGPSSNKMISGELFVNCNYDRTVEDAIKEFKENEENSIGRTKSFLTDFFHLFYSNGRLGRQWEEKVIKPRFSGISKNEVNYKKVVRVLKRCEIIETLDEKYGTKMFVTDSSKDDVTRFVKDGTISSRIADAIKQLV